MAAGDAAPPGRTKSETAAARVDTSVVVAAPASRGDEGRTSVRLDVVRGDRGWVRVALVGDTTEVHARGSRGCDRASVRDAGSARATTS